MKKYGIFGPITYRNRPLSEQLLFGGATFDSFDEAWGFIYENDPNDTDSDHYYDDYYVEELPKETN